MVEKTGNDSADIFGEYIRKMGRTVCLTQAEINELNHSSNDVEEEETVVPETKYYTYWYLLLAEIFFIVACIYGAYCVENNFEVERTVYVPLYYIPLNR